MEWQMQFLYGSILPNMRGRSPCGTLFTITCSKYFICTAAAGKVYGKGCCRVLAFSCASLGQLLYAVKFSDTEQLLLSVRKEVQKFLKAFSFLGIEWIADILCKVLSGING